MLQGKKILLGVTGSIAAYKSALLVRLLVKEGAEVKVIMTSAAKDFITPLTLSTFSKNEVISELFHEATWANHVMLGRWADIMLVAPLSCNTLAKMANGLCDNILLATYLSATCPVVLAPAMDEDMWKHASTKNNLNKLRAANNTVISVDTGELASGLVGEGRMAEPERIVAFISEHIFSRNELKGKKALVTAGPTHEPLDPVRFISNHSSGKMGVELAAELARRGAQVTLVAGPIHAPAEMAGVAIVHVQTAAEMFEACLARFDTAQIAVMAAAVADYAPENSAPEKIKKTGDVLTLELKKTKDILKILGAQKRPDQVLVGFALETNNELENARGKLLTKNADLIVLNSLRDPGAGFGHDTNKITILHKDGTVSAFEQKSKQQVAVDIVDRIIKLLHV